MMNFENREQKTFHVRRLGRMEYGAALSIQREIEALVKRREHADTLLFVEHPHVITLGRRAKEDSVIASKEILEARDVELFESNRGGKATYHGLGQLVGYPVINLSPDREDVHKYVRDLEEVLIRTLGDVNIETFRVKGLTGVHTAKGKIAAIGVHISRWVTTHGFALNVTTDLDFFKLIVPCEGEPVTSMSEMTGRQFTLSEIEDRIIARFAEVFRMKPREEVWSLESGVEKQETFSRSCAVDV
ncbi:MAG: lipoyl(octanoyl) transferase LipB [Pyrinomonadaceae bacterium]